MEQNFDALIWVICAFQNELKMSQIDSSRDFVYFSILNRQKQQDIEYFTTTDLPINNNSLYKNETLRHRTI